MYDFKDNENAAHSLVDCLSFWGYTIDITTDSNNNDGNNTELEKWDRLKAFVAEIYGSEIMDNNIMKIGLKLELTADGSIFDDVRLALGGVGPRPIRLFKIEKMLKRKHFSFDLIQKAAKLAADTVASRTRQDYRREVVMNFIFAALEEASSNKPVTLENNKNLKEHVNA